MKDKYLFYFCNGIGSVFDSQVLAFLSKISQCNIFKKVYLFLGIRNEKQMNDFLARKAHPEMEIVFFKSYPNYQLFNYTIRKSIQITLQSQSINLKEVIFHTRGEMIASHLYKVLGEEYFKNILPDVRGTNIEQIWEFFSRNKFLKWLKVNGYKKALKNLNRSKYIVAVSDSLKEYLIESFKLSSDKIYVIPCLSDSKFIFNIQKRKEKRKELGLFQDEILFVFSSGGDAKWQNSKIILELAKHGYKVLNLSKEIIEQTNVTNKFVRYDEVSDYLNAADIALIWRDKSIVNKVASPVKFSEYVCCGLPVITNNNVDLITSYIEKTGHGKIVNSLESLKKNDIESSLNINRHQISKDGYESFSSDMISEQYLSIYNKINQNKITIINYANK